MLQSSTHVIEDDVFNDVVSTSDSAQTRDLVKLMSQSMVLMAHNRSSGPSVPINSADVNNINSRRKLYIK